MPNAIIIFLMLINKLAVSLPTQVPVAAIFTVIYIFTATSSDQRTIYRSSLTFGMGLVEKSRCAFLGNDERHHFV